MVTKIKGFPYFISSEGFVINAKKSNIIKPSLKKSGYYEVSLKNKEGRKYFLIHRLVALYFVPQKEGANEVNHIDGNKLNNNASNLEWVTRNENLHHAYIKGLRKDDVSARAVIATNMESGEEAEFASIYKASRFFGVSQGNICSCCKGIRPSASGYYWRYKEDE
jgi:hypothetical protein